MNRKKTKTFKVWFKENKEVILLIGYILKELLSR